MLHKVVADANVWYPRTLRDWLLGIEVNGGPYQTCWTEDILAETLYHLRRNHPYWRGAQIADIRSKIVGFASGGQIVDYPTDAPSPWADPNDRHVHAAAVACSAQYLVTNDRGFQDPTVDTDQLPYEIYRPDEFFVLVDDAAPNVVRATTRWQIDYYVRSRGEVDLCAALRDSGCAHFAERVLKHLQGMA